MKKKKLKSKICGHRPMSGIPFLVVGFGRQTFFFPHSAPPQDPESAFRHPLGAFGFKPSQCFELLLPIKV
jgi:hypothetical protein